jgi:hypothetical protein
LLGSGGVLFSETVHGTTLLDALETADASCVGLVAV